MDGKQIYAKALAANVLLQLKDGVLTYKAANGLPDELRDLVRDNKDEVIRYLAASIDAAPSGSGTTARITRLGDRDQMPVSRAQQRIWLAEAQSASGGHFNIQGCFLFEGTLDPVRVDAALRQLIRRHEPLRTQFFEKGGRLHQRVHDRDEISLSNIDLSGVDPSSQASAVRSFVQEDLWRPFDLAADVLLRVSVLRLAADRHVAVFNMHHIISDGWSVGLLMEEFCAAYAGDTTGPEESRIPTLQYGDFAAWQEAWLQGDTLERGMRFWREYLADIPQVHSLPIDRTRPARASFRGERRVSVVGSALERRIREYCVARRVTLFTFLQTAFAALLAHYGSNDDIVMGTPVAGRTSPETESIVGLFVNTVVLRTRVDLGMTFDQLLLANKGRISSAFEYQHVPFELVAESLAHKRSPSYSPVFQVWFVLQNNRQVDFSLPDCRVSAYSDTPEPAAKHELNLYVRECDGTIELEWIFNTGVFQAESIDYLAQQFLTLLEGIVDRPDVACAAHGLFDLDLSGPLAGAMDIPAVVGDLATGGSILNTVRWHAAERANNLAVVTQERSATYAELLHDVRGYAGAIRRHGGTCVALLLDRGVSMVAAMLAALSSGIPYVALDPGYPPDRLRFMVEHAGCDLLVTSPSHAVLAASIAGSVAVVEGGDDACDDLAFAAVDDDATAYILYTSGSTGQPKGVFQSHAGLGYQAGSYAHALGLHHGDRILQLASYSFDASVLDTYGALLAGAELHLADVRTMSTSDLWRRLVDRRITVYHSTPTVFKQLFSSAPRDVAPCVRLVVMGGEHIDEATVEVFRRVFGAECRLVGLYGATESSLTTLNMDCLTGGPVGNLGRPIAGMDVAIVRDDGTSARAFEVGQLAIRGRFIARGYWRDEPLTADSFLPTDGKERVYLTGDTGYALPDGSVRFTGRRDFQVKLNGIRIEIGEVEARLLQLDVVARVAVVATSEPARLVAYVVPATEVVFGDAATRPQAEREFADKCRDALSRWLPSYMIPALFVFTDALPMSPSGKIDRRALAALAVDARADAVYVAPRNALESLLCDIWREVLSLAHVGVDDNLFDVGGTSMHSLRLRQEILDRTGFDVAVTDLFAYPTIGSLVRHLLRDPQADIATTGNPASITHAEGRDGSIAVIGMAGRFPDAPDVETFWSNIAGGIESLRVFTDEEMLAFGVDRQLLERPDYVKSGVLLDGLDQFDASYFGLNPREAEVTDPQQRLLFEAASAALEHAGYGNASSPRRVGVYVGTGESRYLFDNLLPQASLLDAVRVTAMHGNRPAYAATRLAYSLNLSGPAVSIGTACSTSLVAVHSACVSVRNGECDMALAGGSSVTLLGTQGYLFEEGSIASPDGHCRTFDSEARGTRSGSGAGLVVLKRLSQALADGDTIYAVIKGSAINNDGSDKVGYAAPSVGGQAQVIRDAHRVAGIEAETIQYVEAHGTATSLGDPIEVAALTRAFGTAQRQYCALGSVKPNVGHLDSAAGVAGLIKTVKALAERKLPPSINFRQANPKIDFEASPFYVNTELKPWPRGTTPRRAGVSSFGIGGTNAHVVLEEAPETSTSVTSDQPNLLVLSARSAEALATASANLRAHLEGAGRAGSLADIAYTLQLGRTAHPYRRAFVAASVAEAVDILDERGTQRAMSAHAVDGQPPSVVFMFAGQGTQYVRMGRDLYRGDAFFAGIVDRCAAVLRETLGIDLLAALFPPEGDEAAAAALLERTEIGQPALFVLEYALASSLMRCGIRPDALIGHSLGEYVAACVAGVFSLEDALCLVAGRGRLMQQAAPGKMLSFQLPEDEASSLIAAAGCSLAAVNGPADCVAAGSADAIQALATMLERMNVPSHELRTLHAFHSRMMESVTERFRILLTGVRMHPPTMAYISNVTGRFITAAEATDPNYWVRHLLGTVRFAQGLDTLTEDTRLLRAQRIYVEIGPGMTLSALARRHGKIVAASVVSSMRHMHDGQHDARPLLKAMAHLWLAGVPVDWSALHESLGRRRVPLPTYPFERRRYWIEKGTAAATKGGTTAPARGPLEWFYAPVWRQLRAPQPMSTAADAATHPVWLVFSDSHGLGHAACGRLRTQGVDAVSILAGNGFDHTGERVYTIRADADADYSRLLRDAGVAHASHIHVLHLWSVADLDALVDDEARFEQAQRLGFGSLLRLSRVLASDYPAQASTINLVTDCVVAVTGEESLTEAFATTLGLCKVIPQEFPQLQTYHIDIQRDRAREPDRDVLAQRILLEACQPQRPLQVAYRGARRWALLHERRAIEPMPGGDGVAGSNYVITGGLGKIGLELAGKLASEGASGIMLISRTALPDRGQWPDLRVDVHGEHVIEAVALIRQAEAAGAKVIVHAADVSDALAMAAAFDRAERELGRIATVVHGAGLVHRAMRAIGDLTEAEWNEHFEAKARGTRVLRKVIAGRDISACMLMSSLSSVLGGLGFGAYASANSYLDAFAQARHNEGDHRWMAVNWDAWMFGRQKAMPNAGADLGMTPGQGAEAFMLAMRMGHLPQLVNSVGDLGGRIEQWLHHRAEPAGARTLHERPNVPTIYVAPTGDTEKRLVGIWQDMLGIDQIGVHDNFFELGGDSVLLVQAHKAIRARISPEVTIATLFEFLSIAELASFLDRAGDARTAEPVLNKRLERRKAIVSKAMQQREPLSS